MDVWAEEVKKLYRTAQDIAQREQKNVFDGWRKCAPLNANFHWSEMFLFFLDPGWWYRTGCWYRSGGQLLYHHFASAELLSVLTLPEAILKQHNLENYKYTQKHFQPAKIYLTFLESRVFCSIFIVKKKKHNCRQTTFWCPMMLIKYGKGNELLCL